MSADDRVRYAAKPIATSRIRQDQKAQSSVIGVQTAARK
jgi:hypothetical protein